MYAWRRRGACQTNTHGPHMTPSHPGIWFLVAGRNSCLHTAWGAAGDSRGRSRLRGGSEWWNKEVKSLVRGKKEVYRRYLQGGGVSQDILKQLEQEGKHQEPSGSYVSVGLVLMYHLKKTKKSE